jgi:tryptophan-rich sensory protein
MISIDLVKKFLPQILIGLSPLVIGFSTSKLCEMPKSDHLKIQPPGWVFGVVWTFMYLVMGLLVLNVIKRLRIENNLGVRDDYLEKFEKVFLLTLLVIHCILIFLWPYVFSCKKKPKAALFILFGASITGIMLLITSLLGGYMKNYTFPHDLLSYLLVPYNCWLVFAMLLNVEYVQETTKEDT